MPPEPLIDYDPQLPPASRLIPGLPFPPSGATREKFRSATLLPGSWAQEQIHAVPAAPEPGAAAAVCQAILPSPRESGYGYRFAIRVGCDFIIAALNLAVLCSFPMFRTAGMPAFSFPRLTSFLLFGALLTLLGYSEGLYRNDNGHETERVILGKIVAWATLLAAATLCASGTLPTNILFAAAPLTYFSLLAWRHLQHYQSKRLADAQPGMRNILIVGAGNAARFLVSQLDHNGSDGYAIRGFLNNSEPVGGDVLGRVEDLARVARAEFVDEVILTAQTPRNLAQWVIREARRNRLDIKIAPDLFGAETFPTIEVENLGTLPVLTIHREPVPGVSLLLKRVFDVLLSTTVLILTAPLLAVIALVIRLDSRRPAFYLARRIGKKGRRFVCFKFRTMTTDAEQKKEQLRKRNEREGAFFKIARDPRITRVGHFLRRYSLDELPQFFNVLKGEMSIVGPRPHPEDDCALYRLQDLRRLDVTPGITGLWQVTARSDPSFERNMDLDLEYIERWSLWMDLKILWQTAIVVLQGSGA